MANFKSGVGGALGGAGFGAGVGSFVPGIGTAIGAGIGALGGLFGGLFGGDDPESPSYSDIDLAKEDPELYKRIQQNDALIRQYQQAYDMRRAGMTDMEGRGLNSSISQLGSQQANLGLLGTSTGAAQMADYQNQLRGAIQDRAYREQMGLLQGLSGQQNQGYNMTRNALNDAMQARMGQYNNQIRQVDNNNEFWKGLGSMGASMYGLNQYRGLMNPGSIDPSISPNNPILNQNGFGGPTGLSAFAPGGRPWK